MAKEKKTPEKTDSELMRRFRSNPMLVVGTFVVLVIVIIAFVAVPAIVPEYGRGGNMDLTFGYYDKVPVSYVPGNFFAQAYDRIVRSQQNRDNYSFSDDRIWRAAYESAAVHTAILQEMKRSGYTAPEEVVNREVARLPQFQDNGRFSPTLYRQLDDNQRLSLWRQIQDDIAKTHFSSDVTGLLVPGAELDFISSMISTQRSFDMAVFSVDSYPASEYEAYLLDHSDLFRSIHLSMITINASEREAQKILDTIKNGETTFEDAAKAHSKDGYAERGGDLGTRMSYELIMDIPDESDRERVLSLDRNELSGIIKSGSNWVFFRAEEAAQKADDSDSLVMEKVRSYLRNFERGRMEDWAIAQAGNFIAMVNELGFDDAMAQLELEKRSFGPIPLNYGDVELFTSLASQGIPELAASSSNGFFWNAAFSTPVNSPSQPVVQGSNVLVLFPTAETEAEESDIEFIQTNYSYWLTQMVLPQAIQQHFLDSPKMKDNFNETYMRYFFGQQ
jgi:hypothetical protein